MMDKKQKVICAVALYANGYTKYQVGEALGVDPEQAQELIAAGSEAQATGRMGYMKTHPEPPDPALDPNINC